jgi:hypothetical protein
MKYINIENGMWVVYDKDNKRIVQSFDVVLLKSELDKLTLELNDIPLSPTDEELLTWARENYPMFDYSVAKENIQKRIDEINNLLSNIK